MSFAAAARDPYKPGTVVLVRSRWASDTREVTITAQAEDPRYVFVEKDGQAERIHTASIVAVMVAGDWRI